MLSSSVVSSNVLVCPDPFCVCQSWSVLFVSPGPFCVCQPCTILCLTVLLCSVFVSPALFCVWQFCSVLCLSVLLCSVFVSSALFCVHQPCSVLCLSALLCSGVYSYLACSAVVLFSYCIHITSFTQLHRGFVPFLGKIWLVQKTKNNLREGKTTKTQKIDATFDHFCRAIRNYSRWKDFVTQDAPCKKCSYVQKPDKYPRCTMWEMIVCVKTWQIYKLTT